VPASAAPRPAPFFIVGAPRTGTTLLRRMLSSHSRVAIPPESGFMAEYLAADRVPLDVRKRLLCDDPELHYWGIRPTCNDLRPCVSMGECFEFLHRTYAVAQGKDRWGNKTPKLVRHAELLLRHFPTARFVHMVRDGRAVACSLRASRAHRLHVRFGARRYARDTQRGLALERAHPERVIRVRYEDLVEQPGPTLRGVCTFLDLQHEAQMEDPVVDGDLLLTPMERRSGHHARTLEPIRPTSVHAWQSELTDVEVQLIELEAAPALAALGYPLVSTGPPPRRALLQARLAHGAGIVRAAVREVTTRPEVWRLARRRWVLGSFGAMLRDHVGRA
jgi:hypothetical protein